MINWLKNLLQVFLLITAGTIISATIYCTLFFQDITFGIDLLWQLVAVAFFCTVPCLMFYSKKELSKKTMLIRHIIHLCVTLAILIFFAYFWTWIDVGSIIQPIVFVVLVSVVYVTVTFFAYQIDKMTAKQLNERLQQFRQRDKHI